VGVAIADLDLQAHVGERLAQLLELRNGLGFVCSHPCQHSLEPRHTANGSLVFAKR
jgi:hypothetical protein